MMRTCTHTEALRQSLRSGHWPEAADPVLREHVAGCQLCSDDLLITNQMSKLRAATIPHARVGSASLLWWKAQAAKRNAAIARASRPVMIAQVFALFVAVVAAAFLAVTWVHHSVVAESAVQDGGWSWTSLHFAWGVWTIAGMLAVAFVGGGIALYVASDRT